ncbi:MAG: ABC transporter substrate-binding protein [Thiotrichales bacterium]|nr:ABC transporter substrate-binding protein [Thiotrichales bacterium]
MRYITIQRFLLGFVFVFIANSSMAQEEEISPEYVVRNVVNNVLKVLDDPQLDEQQKRLIVFGLISNHIHFEEMSRRILAVHWKTLTDSQKIRFINLFEQNLLNSYWIRVRQYSGEQVKYIASSHDQKGFATVDTVIERDNQEIVIPVTYRMKYTGLEWLAYDFLIENLSLVQNYNREYMAVIKNSGVDGLLEHMAREARNFK